MADGSNTWQICFFVGALLFIAFRAWRGWQAGVVRQVIGLCAVGAAYLTAIFGGRALVPLLRPLGIPDGLLGVVAGALLGVAVYVALTVIAARFLKKDAADSAGLAPARSGLSGAVLGGVLGMFVVWIAVLAIRVLGTVAETEMEAAQRPELVVASSHQRKTPPAPPSGMVRNLAKMKSSLEQGTAGAMVEQVDPIPGTLYNVLAKLGQMISSEQAITRFLSYPGVKTLTEHPKIAALQNDPGIARDLSARNYFGLIRNAQIIRAANDAEIAQLMAKFEFEKALDFAIRQPEKHQAAGNGTNNATN